MGPDSRVLVRKARKSGQVYFRQYHEQIPVAQLCRETAAVMQEFTRALASGGRRGAGGAARGQRAGEQGRMPPPPELQWRWPAGVPPAHLPLLPLCCRPRAESGGVRPFGVSLLMAGYDDHGPQLYQIDPSGSYFAWKASGAAAGGAVGGGGAGGGQQPVCALPAWVGSRLP